MAVVNYVVGQTIINEMVFRLEGVQTDPAIVRCAVRSPNGQVQELVYPSASLVRRDVGQYEAYIVADQAGTWAFRGTGVGVVDAVSEGVVNVAGSTVLG